MMEIFKSINRRFENIEIYLRFSILFWKGFKKREICLTEKVVCENISSIFWQKLKSTILQKLYWVFERFFKNTLRSRNE